MGRLANTHEWEEVAIVQVKDVELEVYRRVGLNYTRLVNREIWMGMKVTVGGTLG